jgi:predicted nucleotidyltransferase component of viral defense system
MQGEIYRKQVRLLLSLLPEIAKEECFALHGGTAINLFVRNMPRLSVDIDLTYLPLGDYESSQIQMNEALERIVQRIQRVLPLSRVQHDD